VIPGRRGLRSRAGRPSIQRPPCLPRRVSSPPRRRLGLALFWQCALYLSGFCGSRGRHDAQRCGRTLLRVPHSTAPSPCPTRSPAFSSNAEKAACSSPGGSRPIVEPKCSSRASPQRRGEGTGTGQTRPGKRGKQRDRTRLAIVLRRKVWRREQDDTVTAAELKLKRRAISDQTVRC